MKSLTSLITAGLLSAEESGVSPFTWTLQRPYTRSTYTVGPQMRCDVAGGIWGRTQVGTSYSCSEVVSCWYRDSRFELASKSQRRYLSYFSMTSPCLNLVIIFYQTQSYHPIILDSDLMKNFQDVILALNDTVHLCSTHWATIRTEYTMIRHIT